MKNDRTLQAIGRQLKAMGCERFDIGVRDATTGQMMNREWSAAEVIQHTPWLKRMNAQGNDVYIRPAEQERHGLVLVPEALRYYVDWDAMARDAEMGGDLFTIETAHGEVHVFSSR